MKELKYYENIRVQYPTKQNYTFYNLFLKDQVLMTGTTASAVRANYPSIIGEPVGSGVCLTAGAKKEGYGLHSYVDEEGFQAQKKAFREEEDRLRNEFKNDLIIESGLELNPKAELLFQKAWDLGRSDGLYSVVERFEDLAELIS